MMITFLLRGIDLPTILFIMGIDLLLVVAATQLAIFVGSLPIGWPVKALLALILLWCSGMGFVGFTFLIEAELIGLGIGSVMADRDFWIGFGISVAMWLAGVGMLFFLCVSMIAPPTANRALLPRLYFTLLWASTLGGMGYLAWYLGEPEALTVWLGFAVATLTLVAVITAGEREVLGPRLRREVPRWRLLRPLAWLFYSGAGGGLVWIGLLWACSITLVYSGYIYLNTSGSVRGFGGRLPDDWWLRNLATACWVMGYLMLAVLICRRLLKFKNNVAVTGVFGLLMMCLVSIVPMLIAYVADPERWDTRAVNWLLLNPFGPMFADDTDWGRSYGAIAVPLSIAFVVLMVLVNLPWFWRQWQQFRPPTEAASTVPDLAEKSPEQIAAMTAEPTADPTPPGPSHG